MQTVSLKIAILSPLLLAAACTAEPEATETNLQQERPPVDLNEVDLPPMVQRSPAYRCDDGDALYVDVLGEKRAVLVRDSRADTPTRLERDSDEGPFSGDGRTLSGTGTEVRYSSEERPDQTCREAEV